MSSESAQMAVPTKDIESVSVGRISLQKIVQSAKPDQDISAIVLELEKKGRGANLGSEFTFENTFGLHKDDLHHFLKTQKKHFLHKFFLRLLHAFKENSNISKESNMVLAAIIKHSLQNVLASIRSARVQNELVKWSTMHPYLAQNYIYASIVIAFPTEYSYKLLHTLQSKGLTPFTTKIGKKIFKEENEKVKRAAFLTYSHLSSRLRDVRLSEKIVKDILQRITSNKKRDVEELTTCIHALNYAGKAVSIGILYTYFANNKIPDFIKVMLVDNLKKRLHDDPLIDQLVRDIATSNDTSSIVKARFIHAQTEREKTIRSASHVKFFSKVHERATCEETKNAI
ncbi:hypothetical protein FDP41_007343 [Naegleria fowleri]|uniref:Uncharacterized protein n=1 Tax=Naegleria fowleri TaxID=5763 RepID=A0A6A5C8S9_NAEFO|nr:uncharacterized protein FDP41_007343 [Naegleria fowleri]KAF0984166.1 hypothetical protein FDP41_007343 [Naegleria fowleri]